MTSNNCNHQRKIHETSKMASVDYERLARGVFLLLIIFISHLSCSPVSSDHVVTTTRLNLRRCPEASGACPVLRTLPEGYELLVLETRGDWIRVADPKRQDQGWVALRYVREAAPNLFSKIQPQVRSDHPRSADSHLFAIRSRSEVPPGVYGLGLLSLSADGVYNLARILSIITNGLVLALLMLALGEAIGMDPRPLIVFMVLSLLLTLGILGPDSLIPGFLLATLVTGLFGTGLGAFFFGVALRIAFPLGILLGSIGLLNLVAGVIRPSVGEIQVLFAVLVVLGAYSTLDYLQASVEQMPTFIRLLFSPPVLTILVLASITVAPVIITKWTWLQIGAYVFGGGLGVLIADEL